MRLFVWVSAHTLSFRVYGFSSDEPQKHEGTLTLTVNQVCKRAWAVSDSIDIPRLLVLWPLSSKTIERALLNFPHKAGKPKRRNFLAPLKTPRTKWISSNVGKSAHRMISFVSNRSWKPCLLPHFRHVDETWRFRPPACKQLPLRTQLWHSQHILTDTQTDTVYWPRVEIGRAHV